MKKKKGICPECGVKMTYLYMEFTKSGSVYFNKNGTFTDEEFADAINEEDYQCAECGAHLANNETDAAEILGVVRKRRKHGN